MAVGLLAVILVVGTLFVGWIGARADREMRADLLRQAQMVAKTVNIAEVQTLSGKAADLNQPGYQRITEQVRAVCSVNAGWRWIYLMGRRSDGAVFFYLDSEPASSKDHAPPGQVYDEASDSFRRVFDTGRAVVDGPYADRWGTWLSALIPLTDPKTGSVIAVLGIDVDARVWKWDVAARVALRLG